MQGGLDGTTWRRSLSLKLPASLTGQPTLGCPSKQYLRHPTQTSPKGIGWTQRWVSDNCKPFGGVESPTAAESSESQGPGKLYSPKHLVYFKTLGWKSKKSSVCHLTLGGSKHTWWSPEDCCNWAWVLESCFVFQERPFSEQPTRSACDWVIIPKKGWVCTASSAWSGWRSIL